MTTPKPVVLCILDGWGLRDDPTGNAPLLANTPNFDAIMRGPPASLFSKYSNTPHKTQKFPICAYEVAKSILYGGLAPFYAL